MKLLVDLKSLKSTKCLLRLIVRPKRRVDQVKKVSFKIIALKVSISVFSIEHQNQPYY